MVVKNKGLGRGLDALIPSYETTEESVSADGVRSIDINHIKPNEKQPRKAFEPEKIKELSDSIRQHGVIQPILVVEQGSDYMIVAGERRFRAAVLAGLKEIPAIVKDFSSTEILQIALIENLQREDLNDMEEALAYKQLSEEFHMKQEEIAERIGKSRAAIANTLRLLTLPESVQNYIAEKKLTAGHARAVLMIEDEKARKIFADFIIKKNLSVRDAEKLSKEFQSDGNFEPDNPAPKIKDKAPYIRQFEEELCENLGTKVSISSKGVKGKIEIEYYSNEDLERLIEILCKDMVN